MMEDHVVPVSVVVPCFRCAATIARAVASIMQQTKKPVEVILVDDASGDGTLDILQALAQQHAGRIKVIALNKNLGAASARNAGWEAASQPYIAFLDADDTWRREKLHIQYEYMCGNPDTALSGHQCIGLRNGMIQPALSSNPAVTKISSNSLIFRNCFSTPTAMLKRNIPFRFSAGKRYAEDMYLWQQIAFSGLPVMRIESPLAYIHKAPYGEGGLSAQLWEMEKGELANFLALYRTGSINLFLFFAASVFSAGKYCKRVIYTRINAVCLA